MPPPLDHLMSVSPDLPTARQNQDVIANNWRTLPGDLVAASNRAMEWFGNDGLLERLRYDRAAMGWPDQVAIAAITQVRRAMEAHTLTAEIQQGISGVLAGLEPAVDALESRRNAVLAAAHTGLRDKVIDQSELADIRGFAATDKAAVERHEAIRKLADGGQLAPELVSPAIPPGLIDADRLAEQTTRLDQAITPQIEASRAAWLTSVGNSVVAKAENYPSPADHQRAMRRLDALPQADRTAVLDAAGRLDLAKQVLGKDKREVDALLERSSGDAATALGGERAAIGALGAQVGSMEKAFLHLLSRPEVDAKHVLSAAASISGADAVLMEPRSAVPTDQKLNPLVGAGVDLARTCHDAGAAPKVAKELRTSLQDTATMAAPEALKTGLDRVQRCSPMLGKLVHDSRARLGPPSAGEPGDVTAARNALEANLVTLGQLDKRTAVRWASEQGALLGEIAADARQAQKATQDARSPIGRIADKVAHEFAKHELGVQRRDARHGVDVTLGPTGQIAAVVDGVRKGLADQARHLAHRVHPSDNPTQPAEQRRQLGM